MKMTREAVEFSFLVIIQSLIWRHSSTPIDKHLGVRYLPDFKLRTADQFPNFFYELKGISVMDFSI